MAAKKQSKGISAGDHSVVVGGNVERSNIVVGNNNTVSNQSIQLAPLFETIIKEVEKQPNLTKSDKEDVKAELQEIQTALEAPKPDETFLARRFRNLKRMSPEIVEVAIETLKNPIGGVVEVIKRIAKKMAEEANEK
jgi:hypothetical protein